MTDTRASIPSPDQCPEPFWHETHRYCPMCSWVEPPAATSKVERWEINNQTGDVTAFRTDGSQAITAAADAAVIARLWLGRERTQQLDADRALAYAVPPAPTRPCVLVSTGEEFDRAKKQGLHPHANEMSMRGCLGK